MPIPPETAALLRVLIASPGDMTVERDLVEKMIAQWNALHSDRQSTVLLPLRWEYNATPRVGSGDGQQVINRELVNRAHVLITLFGHRIGTATPRAVSGTAEEVAEAMRRGMPVHVLFSRKPYPPDLDTVQLDGVRAYETELSPLGLIGYFENDTALADIVLRCLVSDVDELVGGVRSARASPRGALLRASVTRPGSPLRLVIKNEGADTAVDVSVRVETLPDGNPVLLLNSNSLVTLGPGDGWSYPVLQPVSLGSEVRVRLEWTEPPSAAPMRSDLQLQLP